MTPERLSIKRDRDNEVIFFDNSYGDLAIMIRGPRRGILGEVLLSPEDVRTLIKFLEEWKP